MPVEKIITVSNDQITVGYDETEKVAALFIGEDHNAAASFVSGKGKNVREMFFELYNSFSEDITADDVMQHFSSTSLVIQSIKP